MIYASRTSSVSTRLRTGFALLLWLPVVRCEVPLPQGCPENITTSTDAGEAYATVEWYPPVAQNGTTMTALASATGHKPGDRFGIGTTRIVYVLYNETLQGAGNCTFFIHVQDNEVPVFLSCPPNITINLTSARTDAVAAWQPPIASDNSGFYSLTSDHDLGDFLPVGETSVHYTATDASKNVATCEFAVSIQDLTPLEFSNCPKDVTHILQSGQSGDRVTWQEPIISLEGRDVSISATHRPGEWFDMGHTGVSYTAVDNQGNSGYCNFIVIVTGFPYNHFTRTVASFLPGSNDRILLHSSPEECLTACIVEEAFICRSVDISNEGKCMLSRRSAADLWEMIAANKEFTHYERLMGNTRPVLIGCPKNMTRPTEAGQAYAIVSWSEPTMSDSEPVQIIATHLPDSRFYVGETQVVYEATDDTGGILSCGFFITIKDREAPVIRDCPQTITKLTSVQETVKAWWVEPKATDNLGAPQLNGTHKPGDWFPPGSTNVTYSAQDQAGNQAECSFTVTIKDIPGANYISFHLILDNITYVSDLHNNNSEEFQKLASTVEKDVLKAFNDDITVLGVFVAQFRSDGDDVIADVKIGFSQPLSPQDQRDKLSAMLAATVNKIMENVTQVKLEQDNGNLAILDACTLSPCPVTMKCRPTGLQCSATCTDNPDYCLNGGKCWTNAQNLVMCDCNNEHHVYAYSGDRCDLTRIALTGKQLIVISVGGVWFAMMLGVLAICVIAHRCKRHAKREKGAEANYLMHVLQGRSAESPAGMTSEDLGYTSQGEGEMSLPDSDVQAGIDSAGSQEEPAPHLAEGTLGVREGPDGFAGPYERSTSPRGSCAGPRDSSVCPQDSLIGPHDISAGRQDGYTLKEHSYSGSRTSCSSCTSCTSSPCCASQSLNSHSSCSCSCDSGTEVVEFPGTSNSTKMHREGASASVARPLLITVQADVERIPFAPSDVAHSYDGEIPDPLIDSEMPEDEQIHFVNSHPQASPKDPQETTPLLSHYWDGYTCTPNPAFEFDQSFDTTPIIETRPELIKSASERASFSSGRTHSYDGTIPDPVLDFDDRQSNDEKLSNETMPTSDKTPMESAINSERSTCQVLCSLPSTNEGRSDVVMTEEHFV